MSWITEQIAEVEDQAKRKRLSIRQACALAGIPPSTFSRWKTGLHEPRMGLFQKVKQAVENYPAINRS